MEDFVIDRFDFVVWLIIVSCISFIICTLIYEHYNIINVYKITQYDELKEENEYLKETIKIIESGTGER